jgi:hypothetical protein
VHYKRFAFYSQAAAEMSQRIVTHRILLSKRVGFEYSALSMERNPPSAVLDLAAESPWLRLVLAESVE